MRNNDKLKKYWQAFFTAQFCESNDLSTKEGIKAFQKHAEKFQEDRRNFLKKAGVAGLVGSTGMILPFGRGNAAPPPNPSQFNIAIVGAGISGLACADVLTQQGVFPTIYEARSRVGGRIVSVRPGSVKGKLAELLNVPGADDLLNQPGWRSGGNEYMFSNLTSGFQTGEAGAEIINTGHQLIRSYATEFKLKLENFTPSGETYYLLGLQDKNTGICDPNATAVTPTFIKDEEVVEAYREAVPIFRDDYKSLTPPTAILAQQNKISQGDLDLDRMNLDEYFCARTSHLQHHSVLFSALLEDYRSEYGDETDNQSPLLFLLYAHFDRSSKYRPYGIFGDERFLLVGGCDQIPLHIARRVQDTSGKEIQFNHELEEVDKDANGKILLKFKGNSSWQGPFDSVIFAMPFSVLRYIPGMGPNPGSNPALPQNQLDPSRISPTPLAVETNTDNLNPNRLGLSELKRRAIHNLDYGANVKAIFAFNGPVWRNFTVEGKTFNSNGATRSDPDSGLNNHQSAWETSQSLASATSAIMTDYSSGVRGAALGAADPQVEGAKFLADLDKLYVEAQKAAGVSNPVTNLISSKAKKEKGKLVINLHDWQRDPYSRGSYTNNQPNYFVQIADIEGTSEISIMEMFKTQGNPRVFFAGEHADPFSNWQGFMDGAVNSGIKAANDLLSAIKFKKITK